MRDLEEEERMADTRHKNVKWFVAYDFTVVPVERAQLAVLMGIRDELQATRDLIAGVLEWLRENSAEKHPAKKWRGRKG